MYYVRTGKKIIGNNNCQEETKEGFSKMKEESEKTIPLNKFLKKDFSPTTPANPLSNALLTDIEDNPDKKSAPPSFQRDVYGNINTNTKEMIKHVNPDSKDIDEKLFSTLGENFDFDMSMRQFYSTPNTRIVNDQGAFAQYLYGNMPSCKEGDVIQCASNNQRYNLY